MKVRRDVVFDESNLHYYKPDVIDLPMGEPLAENDVFGDLLLTSVGDDPVLPQPLPTKTITVPFTDDGDDIYRTCLERADGSSNSEDENGQDEDNTRGGSGGDSDHSGNDDSNSDSQNSSPPLLHLPKSVDYSNCKKVKEDNLTALLQKRRLTTKRLMRGRSLQSWP